MRLHDATKQAVEQFGAGVVTDVRLANIVADMKGYNGYPAMKQVFRDILKDGFGRRIYDTYPQGSHILRDKATAYAQEFNSKHKYKQDLVDYGFNCLLWSLGCTDSIDEPVSRGFDPNSKGDADLLSDLPSRLAALQKQYTSQLDRLIVSPQDTLKDAPAYYSAESLNRLYSIEAKIAVFMQQTGKGEYDWCREQRRKKLAFLHAQQKEAIDRDKKRRAKERNARLRRRMAIGAASMALLSMGGMGASYISSADAIGRFERTIEMGEQSATNGDYGKALQLFESAKADYDGSFRSSHYRGVADGRIATNIDWAIAECENLVSEGKLTLAKSLLTSLPESVVSVDENYAAKIKTATEALYEAVNSGIEELAANISNNKGCLDASGREKLEELLNAEPDNYWLNFINSKKR